MLPHPEFEASENVVTTTCRSSNQGRQPCQESRKRQYLISLVWSPKTLMDLCGDFQLEEIVRYTAGVYSRAAATALENDVVFAAKRCNVFKSTVSCDRMASLNVLNLSFLSSGRIKANKITQNQKDNPENGWIVKG